MTTEEGKYKLGNKAHDTLRTSIKFINQQGETLKLLSLLKHTNKAVRVWQQPSYYQFVRKKLFRL